MEMVREYLIVSFLFRQKRELRSTKTQNRFGFFGKPTGVKEYSPEMVRKTIYREFGKSPEEVPYGIS